MKGSKNTVLCDYCVHQEVCKLKKETLAAQEALNRVNADLGKTENGYAMKRITDMNWIKVTLYCVHYLNERDR